jgi:hypothetical protein
MAKIFLAPRSGKQSFENFQKTIENGYKKKDIESSLSDEDRKALEGRETLYIWGNRPGGKAPWEDMNKGDYVFFYQQGRITWIGQLLYKTHNKELADKLWGKYVKGDEVESYEYVYFLENLRKVNMDYAHMKELAGYNPKAVVYGFQSYREEGIQNIEAQYGSIEEFIESHSNEETTDDIERISREEFIDVMRRYKEEGTVFQSVTRGARYYIESVDDAGCIVNRIDANEPERCTASGYETKKELMRNSGGTYKFNDFDGTAAKRTTYLQGLSFGIGSDRETIFDLSDEDKALDTFCDLVKNLKVDTTHGTPKLYKPAMLACVVEGLETGQLTENKIEFNNWITTQFIEKMGSLGEDVSETQAATAFYHLTGDLFWMLCYHNPSHPFDTGTPGPAAVRERVKHAIIKDTFWRVLKSSENRQKVMQTIAEKWWPNGSAKGTALPTFWWVNQGRTYSQEKSGGFIWAPKQNEQGQLFFHWTNVSNVNAGDVIFNYANGAIKAISIGLSAGYGAEKPSEIETTGWEKEGWRVDLNYFELANPIRLEDITKALQNLEIVKGPINFKGGVNQGYLYEIPEKGAKIIIDRLDLETLPEEIRKVLRQLSSITSDIIQEIPKPEKRAEMLSHLISFIEKSGFIFEPWHIASYYTAIRTKPFAILAGVTGTGKSKLPQLVSKASGSESLLIPVRPDWTDSSEVLGYKDLQGDFQPGPFLEYCAKARNNRNRHFVCIVDEMNLARVEHYFAEVLSKIEDRYSVREGGYESGGLILQGLHGDDASWLDVGIPSNLAIVGTVNMDESAHGFSRKVLDRAFTIELSDIQLSKWKTTQEEIDVTNEWPASFWWPRAIQLSGLDDITEKEEELIEDTINILNDINRYLINTQLQMGYRTRDEIALFRLHAQEILEFFVTSGGDIVDPMDIAVSMKILPRIVGGSGAIRRLLRELLGWAYDRTPLKQEEECDEILRDWEDEGRPEALSNAVYPRMAGRLCLMWDRIGIEGFTSYWA